MGSSSGRCDEEGLGSTDDKLPSATRLGEVDAELEAGIGRVCHVCVGSPPLDVDLFADLQRLQ
jgi:hypothetical protein